MKYPMAIMLVFSLCLASSTWADEVEEIPNPVELGQVKWFRNYDQAVQLSEQKNKPILILFQEVPGCSTCRNYGKNVLSHPLIVDAIEHEFIPLAIHNNKGGADKKVLQSFGEPAWNNPVVRIIDANRKELTGRIAAQYTQLDLVKGMQNAIQNSGRQVPAYLNLLVSHLEGEKIKTEKATFGMYCFWTGESKLGDIDGVLSSQPGFMGGSEVVTVEYNPKVISYEELTREATKRACYDQIFVHSDKQKRTANELVKGNQIRKAGSFRMDKDPQYYLSKSIYRYLPLLPIQASRINSGIATRTNVEAYLSPSQRSFLKQIKQQPNKKWKERYHSQYFAANWEELSDQLK